MKFVICLEDLGPECIAKPKNKGIVIGEDLTFANHKVYVAAVKHSACSSAWTVNGKIFAKLTNGTKMKLDMHTDVDRAFRRVMGGPGRRDRQDGGRLSVFMYHSSHSIWYTPYST